MLGCTVLTGCEEGQVCETESSEIVPDDELEVVDAEAAEFVAWLDGSHPVEITSGSVDGREEALRGVFSARRLDDAPELWTSTCSELINVHYELSLAVETEGERIDLVPPHRVWLPASWTAWRPLRPGSASYGELSRLDALLETVDLPEPHAHYVDVELRVPGLDGTPCSGRITARARAGSSREDQDFAEFRCL